MAFFFCFVGLSPYLYADGKAIGISEFGTTVYACVVGIVNIRSACMCHCCTWLHHLFIWLSILIIPIAGQIIDAMKLSINFRGTIARLIVSPVFYFTFSSAIACSIVPVLGIEEYTIAKLTVDYDLRQKDCARLLENRSLNIEKSAAKQKELVYLQQELEQCKQSSRITEEPRSRYRPPKEPDFVRRPTAVIPPAMKDNLVFGDDRPLNRAVHDFTVVQMSDAELKLKFQTLTREKDEKERILNRVPPKEAKMARVRIEKDQLDDEVNTLGLQISKVQRELGRRGIY
jgi:hypothetical protein